jgi:heme-degrading monooxygenase HmoA
MVIREWRGRASPTTAHAYPAHFRSNVLPELHHVPGFQGAYLAQHLVDGTIEFVVLTHWESANAIRRFAGNDIAKAVVEPGAVAALVDFDATVRHYEVIEAVSR